MKHLRMALLALLLAPAFAAAKAPDTGKTMLPEAGQAVTFRGWQRRAEAAEAEAKRALGIFFHMGLFVVQDLCAAARWYRMAAERGNADAQFDIGFRHRFGRVSLCRHACASAVPGRGRSSRRGHCTASPAQGSPVAGSQDRPGMPHAPLGSVWLKVLVVIGAWLRHRDAATQLSSTSNRPRWAATTPPDHPA